MKLLFYADYGCISGFSHVSEKIIQGLLPKMSKNDSIDIWAINYFGETKKMKENVYLYSSFNQQEELIRNEKDKKIESDPYGRLGVIDRIRKKEYDTIFFFNDLSVISGMYGLLNVVKRSYSDAGLYLKFIFYFPVDGKIGETDLKAFLPNGVSTGDIFVFDKLITFTKWGIDMVKDAISKFFNPTDYLINVKRISCIGHAVDKESFVPVDEYYVNQFRMKYMRSSQDVKIIGQVNRNSVRKDYPTSLIGFSKFIRERKDDGDETVYKYYMHCNPHDNAGYKLFEVCGELDIPVENVLFPPGGYEENKGTDQKDMNLIYRCFDMFLTTTTAEGWGLSVFEAAYLKIPVIAPLNTALEYFYIEENFKFVAMPSYIESISLNDSYRLRKKCDPSDVEHFIKGCLSKDRDFINKSIEASKSFVDSLSWETIQKQWNVIFLNYPMLILNKK